MRKFLLSLSMILILSSAISPLLVEAVCAEEEQTETETVINEEAQTETETVINEEEQIEEKQTETETVINEEESVDTGSVITEETQIEEAGLGTGAFDANKMYLLGTSKGNYTESYDSLEAALGRLESWESGGACLYIKGSPTLTSDVSVILSSSIESLAITSQTNRVELDQANHLISIYGDVSQNVLLEGSLDFYGDIYFSAVTVRCARTGLFQFDQAAYGDTVYGCSSFIVEGTLTLDNGASLKATSTFASADSLKAGVDESTFGCQSLRLLNGSTATCQWEQRGMDTANIFVVGTCDEKIGNTSIAQEGDIDKIKYSYALLADTLDDALYIASADGFFGKNQGLVTGQYEIYFINQCDGKISNAPSGWLKERDQEGNVVALTMPTGMSSLGLFIPSGQRFVIDLLGKDLYLYSVDLPDTLAFANSASRLAAVFVDDREIYRAVKPKVTFEQNLSKGQPNLFYTDASLELIVSSDIGQIKADSVKAYDSAGKLLETGTWSPDTGIFTLTNKGGALADILNSKVIRMEATVSLDGVDFSYDELVKIKAADREPAVIGTMTGCLIELENGKVKTSSGKDTVLCPIIRFFSEGVEIGEQDFPYVISGWDGYTPTDDGYGMQLSVNNSMLENGRFKGTGKRYANVLIEIRQKNWTRSVKVNYKIRLMETGSIPGPVITYGTPLSMVDEPAAVDFEVIEPAAVKSAAIESATVEFNTAMPSPIINFMTEQKKQPVVLNQPEIYEEFSDQVEECNREAASAKEVKLIKVKMIKANFDGADGMEKSDLKPGFILTLLFGVMPVMSYMRRRGLNNHL